jgi:hypothetical protein
MDRQLESLANWVPMLHELPWNKYSSTAVLRVDMPEVPGNMIVTAKE